MDPQGPSQPSIDTAYENPKNPIDQTISEIRDASSVNSDPISDRRKHNDAIDGEGNDQSEATPSSLAYGALDASGDAGESVSSLAVHCDRTRPRPLIAGLHAGGRCRLKSRRRTDACNRGR